MMATYSEWFENLWVKYGAEEGMSNAQKGSKTKAWQSWEKRVKAFMKSNEGADEQAFAQHVWRGYEAQRQNRRALKSANQFVPHLTMVTTWLNQERYDQELDIPTSEAKRMATQHHCHVNACGERVIGLTYEGKSVCKTHHVMEWNDANREPFRRCLQSNPRQPGESWRDWAIRDLERSDLGRAVLKRLQERAARSQGGMR